jgi:hypothetical protein
VWCGVVWCGVVWCGVVCEKVKIQTCHTQWMSRFLQNNTTQTQDLT